MWVENEEIAHTHSMASWTSSSGKPVGTNVISCKEFKKMDVQSHWQKAKQLRLCYTCLGRNHKGERCAQNSRRGIYGCQKMPNQVYMEISL